MKKFFFTFCMKSVLRNNYVEIEAEDAEAARAAMGESHGMNWAFCYTEDGFRGQPEKYGLTEVPLDTPNSTRYEYQD